jgi:hypothetical protein
MKIISWRRTQTREKYKNLVPAIKKTYLRIGGLQSQYNLLVSTRTEYLNKKENYQNASVTTSFKIPPHNSSIALFYSNH